MRLAQAAWQAVRSIVEKPVPHPPTYVHAVLDLLRFLRRDRGTPAPQEVSRADYERWRNEAARAWTMDDPTDLDKFVVGGYYNLFAVEPIDRLALTVRKDAENDLFHGGREIADADDALAARRLAWNYVLLFPEVLDVLQLFPHLGARQNAVDARVGAFVFCRKLNPVVCKTLFNEAQALGLLSRVEGPEPLYRVGAVPAPVRMALAVESYLQVSGRQLDVSLPRREVEEQLGFVLPQTTIEDRWQAQLRPAPLLRQEVGGSKLRLTPDDFLWLIERRLVAPAEVGRVLVRQNEGEASSWLLSQFEPRLQHLSPIANLDDFRSAFA
jgi:hypothetical protein